MLALMSAAVLATGSAPPVVMHGNSAAARAIVAAERAFAARAQAVGPKAAFREAMDPALSVTFSGGAAVRGAEAISALQGEGYVLSWDPQEVIASESGDMGVDWGRYTLTAVGRPAQGGFFTTVWRRGPEGGWKAVADIGTPDPRPPAPRPAG